MKKDWKVVWEFGIQKMAIVLVCLLFSGMVVMMTAIDSLEAAFAKEVLYLSDSVYGFLVSIAGAGIIVGAICTMIFAKN
ncbi:hypothetical protein [Lentibacillus sp. Marseille-P4043]|uniref:hypothetical protein n=1 Tax=Lentibacillus sp. Marseille-P4043 TaxID=2040293 RepID=UPI000D0AE80B|nr:hypothetical protein [Lentibacillus sp. Marseille-P4043]